MQARELNFGEHVSLYPSFTIRSLLDNIRDSSDNEDYVHDLTHSKYYTTSEFLTSKIPKDSFSMFHINIASLGLHLEDLKMLSSILNHPFDVIAVSETKIEDGIEPVTNIFVEVYHFHHTPTKQMLLYGSTSDDCQVVDFNDLPNQQTGAIIIQIRVYL